LRADEADEADGARTCGYIHNRAESSFTTRCKVVASLVNPVPPKNESRLRLKIPVVLRSHREPGVSPRTNRDVFRQTCQTTMRACWTRSSSAFSQRVHAVCNVAPFAP